MFENLTDKFERAFKVLKGQGQITEINVAETLKEVRRALLDADVNFNTAKSFTNSVKEKALGRDVLNAISPGQLMVKICHEELIELMGGEETELNLKGSPSVILMSGLQGSGKTTFTGKLGNYLNKKKRKQVLLVACDVYRPAAIDQLHVLGEQLALDVYSERENKNPVSIAKNAIEHAKKNGKNVVIVDTAGRLAVDKEMMDEIYNIKTAITPSETLFVVDAMTGQDAANTAKAFDEALPLTGVVLTKADGDARGGAALSVRHITGKPIKFIGTGEKIDGLEPFYPDRIASRILGMGDVLSLIEEAEQKVDKKQAERLARKIKKGKGFDLEDFKEQLKQMQNMGGVASIMEKMPGMGALPPGAASQVDDSQFRRMEAIINSMTPRERLNPELLNGSRKRRITQGSGTEIQDLNRLLKQHKQMQKMMKKMKGGGMANMMRGLGGMQSKMGPGGMPGMPPGGKFPRF